MAFFYVKVTKKRETLLFFLLELKQVREAKSIGGIKMTQKVK